MSVAIPFSTLMWPGVTTCLLTLAFTPAFRTLFHKWGILDVPDVVRRIHTTPTPRVGGMAIAAALLTAFILLCWFAPMPFAYKQLEMISRIAPSAIIVFGTGVLDDVFGLRARQKLFAQTIAAGLACYSGIAINGGWWAVPLSMAWLIGCTNGFNLIDGMDGLAGGAGLIGAATIGIAAILQGDIPLAVVVLALAGGLVGFLRFNIRCATVFLGDSGSLFLGFVLGCAGLIWARALQNQAGLLAPALVLSVPLLDVSLAILRRVIGRRPIFSADLGHVHHRLLSRDSSRRRALIRLYAAFAVAGAFGLAESFIEDTSTQAFVLAIYIAIVLSWARYLGYFSLNPFPDANAALVSPDSADL